MSEEYVWTDVVEQSKKLGSEETAGGEVAIW